MREEVVRLENHADLCAELGEGAALLGQFLPVNLDGTAGDGFEAVDGSAEGRFAGTRRAEEDDDFALAHGKVDVLQNVISAVVLVDVGNLYEIFLCCGSCLCGHH